MSLGETIYALRMEKNMSQGDLADALEVSRQSVSKWENNSAVPELDKLVKMAHIFGITLDEMVWGRILGFVTFGGNTGKVGKVGKVDNVKLSDEDLKVYRDLAERRYMNNIELKTLAPEINVTLPAGASGNLSAQDVADKLKRMLIEQMAAQTSVSHAY